MGSTDAFHGLGALRIEWRVRVMGSDGAALGERLVRHVSAAASGDRERLEFDDGRVYVRLHGEVQAERNGMPWPTLEVAARKELELFSLQASMPWCLVDPARFVAGAAPCVAAGTGTLAFSRIPRPAKDEIGPPKEAARGSTVLLIVEAASGTLREVVLAADLPSARRQVVFEDWRPWNGLSFPFRRTWLDAEGRPATVLEIVEIEAGVTATDRDFRLR